MQRSCKGLPSWQSRPAPKECNAAEGHLAHAFELKWRFVQCCPGQGTKGSEGKVPEGAGVCCPLQKRKYCHVYGYGRMQVPGCAPAAVILRPEAGERFSISNPGSHCSLKCDL